MMDRTTPQQLAFKLRKQENVQIEQEEICAQYVE